MKINIIVIFGILLLVKAAQAAGGEGIPVNVVIYQTINVTLLVGLLYFLTRKKVAAYLVGRVETHDQAKIQAKKAMDEAQERHRDLESKLKGLQEAEAQTIKRAQNDALEMKSKLIQEAEVLAKRLVDDARKTTTFEHEKAKQGLREEAFDMAIQQARDAIQKNVTKDDQKNLQKQFIDSIGAAH